MALSNRDRIDQMFQAMAPALDDFIATVVGQESAALGAEWVTLVEGKDLRNGVPEGKTYDPLDPQVQFRMLTESNITSGHKKGWYPFNQTLGKAGESFAIELREVRNRWAHNGTFSDDDAYRALDTGERLLRLAGSAADADRVRGIRLNLRRVTADKDDKRTLKSVASDNPEGVGLRPWREVLRPHDDVATGNFHASEFAADLYKVATGGERDNEYSDPVEFFRRTYLTEGLRDLITRAVNRLAGNQNASPVINLQTNFGGGKTHSMLSLWHLAGGVPQGDFPQETQDLIAPAHYGGIEGGVRRVAIVGHHLAATGSTKSDGTQVNTIWGELAWQLGGRDAYAIVAESDQKRTPPGEALHRLLAEYSPALILIDEWVAYARALVGRDDLAGGTFDDQFTFAQQLTEVVKGTPRVLLAISIPASERGTDGNDPIGNAEEVGGANGLEALKRLQNVVRRVADQWRPASSTEAYDIVKQRLFVQPDAEALASIRQTSREYVDYYRKYDSDFPREAKEAAYEERIRRTYPIHPELFDTLYQEWSSLERFQRTRGVLRLMSEVIHALWNGEDASPLIMPGSIPLAAGRVNSELTQYLQDSWKAIIDADVDGAQSEPARIDREKPVFGQRSLTRRLARTVFFGAAPTIGSAHKGIETARVFLGTAVPGDVPGNFHSALNQLADRATYFYTGQGKFWYDTQANITRAAKDQAERLHREDVWAEIVRRLTAQERTRGSFARLHICPEDSADIPDIDEAGLVILHPKVAHKRKTESAALAFAKAATERKGTANRTYRNMLVYLAADEDRLGELENAVRDYLGWSYVLGNEAELDLSVNQKNQADQRRLQAHGTVESRLAQTFVWALLPSPAKSGGVIDAGAPFVVRETKVEGTAPSLADRVSRKLGNDGDLSTRQAAATIRLAINQVPAIWSAGHVSAGELWKLYATYTYMPRLRDRSVLNAGITDLPMIWQTDAFALATAYEDGRYVGLVAGEAAERVAVADSTLLVNPKAAEEQFAAEKVAADEAATADDAGGVAGGATASAPTSDGKTDTVFSPPAKELTLDKRFFGSKTLDSHLYTLDFKKVADEILTHLAQPGVKLTVRLEIEAEADDGFDESKVRTVSENATTLKFDQSGFEKE